MYWQESWFQLQWPEDWDSTNVAVKELVPIVIAAAIWGPQWIGLNVLALCDNYAVVQAINARRAKDWDIMRLLRCLFFFSAHFKFTLSLAHVQGVKNSIADAISRNRLSLLQKLSPQIYQETVVTPAPLKKLVLDRRSDWTSQRWRERFSAILKRRLPVVR